MSQLDISGNAFRALANRVTDISAQYLDGLTEMRAYPDTSARKVSELFESGLPTQGDGARVIEELAKVIAHSRPNVPRFYGYVLGAGDPVAALGDYFASVLNQNVTAWRSSPAAVTIERTVVSWLAEAVGCKGFSGSLTGGGSAANLMALAIAREAKLPANEHGVKAGGRIYASSEIHMSIGKAVAMIGIGRENLRAVPVNDEYQMNTRELDRMISEDVISGVTPIAVLASAGTVNTGAIDDLREVAAIAKKHDAWFHVDGAYGALAAIAAPEKFRGLELADSLSLDPHKWLYQPVDCGCLLYRDPSFARKAFAYTGDYTKVLNEDPQESFALFEESMELSRRFRALKLWLSLRYHGMGAFRDAIANDLQLAQHLAKRIEQEPSLELMAPAKLSAVCFRYVGGDVRRSNSLNAAILKRMIQRGRVFISNATLQGKFALRACIVNQRATERDVEEVVSEALEAAKEVEE
jgi:glutamate/tyrosine decarboxylase-like PLP-dependent enzyme